jgi:hypothetical protein
MHIHCQTVPNLEKGLAEFNASYSDPSSLDAYSVRVDQVVSSKTNLFGRYDYSPSTLGERGTDFYSALSGNELL